MSYSFFCFCFLSSSIRNNCYWCLQGNVLLLYPNKEAYLRNPTKGSKMFKLTAHMHVKDVAEKVRTVGIESDAREEWGEQSRHLHATGYPALLTFQTRPPLSL